MSGLALLLGGVCRFRSSGHNAHSLVATVIVGATLDVAGGSAAGPMLDVDREASGQGSGKASARGA
jgi:hypothetical protein